MMIIESGSLAMGSGYSEGHDISRTRELAILDACRDLAEELALVDPADYICLLHTVNMIALDDLVSSSIEPYFLPGSVTFACSGDYALNWEHAPVVALDFEFLHEGIFAFFRIVLTRDGPNIELNHINFENTSTTPARNTEQLRRAFSSASLR